MPEGRAFVGLPSAGLPCGLPDGLPVCPPVGRFAGRSEGRSGGLGLPCGRAADDGRGLAAGALATGGLAAAALLAGMISRISRVVRGRH